MANDSIVRDTGDKQQIEKVAKTQALKEKQLHEDMVALLQSASGRRILWMILKQCKIFETIWDPSAKIHFNAGQQNIGLFVLAKMMKANPNALVQLMTENSPEEEMK